MPRRTASEVNWHDMAETDYKASRLLKTIGSPKTYALVKLLLKNEVMTVEEITEKLDRSQWDVSKMLKPLRDLDVVRFQKDGRYTLYTLKDRKGIESLLRYAEDFTRSAGTAH